jgi:nucleoside-diphosphate-sugar epimerase
MKSSGQCCAITGANGYLGSRLSAYFAARDWKVLELARHPNPQSGPRQLPVPYALERPVDAEFFRANKVRALVHCAYDFRPTDWASIRRVNVVGSIRLLQAAKQGDVETIVFVSTISAFEGCRSLYGKAKLEIEHAAAELGACIIRPGLVYAETGSGGRFASLERSVEISAVLPLIGSGRNAVYLIHETDLSELIFRICTGEAKFPATPFVAASAQVWRFRDLLRALAAVRGRRIWFLPLPWQSVWLGLRALELLGIAPPFRSDSVLSSLDASRVIDFSLAAQPGYRFRSFDPTALKHTVCDAI